MVCSKSSSNPDFLTTEGTEDTERRNLLPVSELGFVEALKDHPGCPKSPSSKPKKNSVCSVSSVVKKIQINHHEVHEVHEEHEDWKIWLDRIGPQPEGSRHVRLKVVRAEGAAR